jgi:hypothetical protein
MWDDLVLTCPKLKQGTSRSSKRQIFNEMQILLVQWEAASKRPVESSEM